MTGPKPMTERETIEHLWELYEAAAYSVGSYKGPTVEDELETLFPDDNAKQSYFRDLLIDKARKRAMGKKQKCPECGAEFKNRRARAAHQRKVHGGVSVDEEAVVHDLKRGIAIKIVTSKHHIGFDRLYEIADKHGVERRRAS